MNPGLKEGANRIQGLLHHRAAVVVEPGTDHCVFQGRGVRGVNRLTFEKRSLPANRGEQLVPLGVEACCGEDRPAIRVAHGHAVVRDTVDEIRRSVDWIDDPQMLRHVVLARDIFLTQEDVIRMRLGEKRRNCGLRLVIGVGDGVPVSLEILPSDVVGGDAAKMALIHLPTDPGGANRIGQEEAELDGGRRLRHGLVLAQLCPTNALMYCRRSNVSGRSLRF